MKKSFLVVLLLVILGGVLFWPGRGSNFVEITVESGMSAHDVADQLKEKGLIRMQLPFLVWTRVFKAGSKIHVGRYKIPQGRSSYGIVRDLIEGNTERLKFVVPEGFASWQIAERLEQMGLCSSATFLKIVQDKALEGFLFPATYELEYGLAAQTIAEKMKEEFDRRWTPEFEARAKELKWTKKEVVTLASIVEREVRASDERPLVSAVYHNRLKKRMMLQADPTVQYALGYWKDRLTYDDYRNTKSPYNTYINFGLPPGPIASPGVDSIRAALWPADSPALYFVARPDGRHNFSTTYREHTNKVNARNRSSKKNMIETKPTKKGGRAH